MWVMTPRGFYSAVEHRDDPSTVIVRARVRRDLLELRDLTDEPIRPIKMDYADYRYRVELSKAEWARIAAGLALEVEYPNFKNAVKAVQGDKRARVYMRVWSALLELQPRRRLADGFRQLRWRGEDLDYFDDPYEGRF